jgi:coenzyme F420 hydrogenase subunit beta
MVDRSDPASTVWAPMVGSATPRDLCTDCGISRSSDPKQCGHACQFIKPNYPALEVRVHGRTRDIQRPDELFFGPFRRMVRASLLHPRDGAQWTGIATRLGERLLETGAVDAVLTVAPDPDDKWKPVPVLVTSAAGMAQCRGMRMGYAPLLALLEPAKARGFRRIAVIGIPCQVYALRSLEAKLGFERLYVVGTPCSDNTTTANFHTFLDLLSDDPNAICNCRFPSCPQISFQSRAGPVSITPTCWRTSPSAIWAARGSNGYWYAMNEARNCSTCSAPKFGPLRRVLPAAVPRR